jgi:putative inorganic carbon (HCO3(-)) transporter
VLRRSGAIALSTVGTMSRLRTLPPTDSITSAASVTSLAALAGGLGVAVAAFAALFDEAAPIAMPLVVLLPILLGLVFVKPGIGAIAVLAAMPVGSQGLPVGPLELQAVEGAVLIVAALVVLRRLAAGNTPLPWDPALNWPLLLLTWALASLYWAIDEGLAVKQILSLVGGMVFACVILAECRTMLDLRRIAGAFVVVATAISVTALASRGEFESAYGGAQVVSGRLAGAFDHPNQLASFCAMVAPLAAVFVIAARSPRARLASGAALILIAGALTLSLSRGAWIGTALAFLFLLVKLAEARRLLAILIVPLVALGFFTWSLAPTTTEIEVVGERARSLTRRSPYDHREVIYDEAIREVRAKPVTGYGPGSFPVASVRAGSESSTVSAEHAHNLLLTWAAELGVPGALLLIAFGAALALATAHASRDLRRSGAMRERVLLLGLAAGLIAVTGQCFFDYTLRNAVVHVSLWGFVGALLAYRRAAAGSPTV